MAVKMAPKRIILHQLGIEKGGKVHKFLTEECARRMDRFVPYREGNLAHTTVRNGRTTSNVKTGKIVYAQPYASYVYYGISKSGKPLNYTKTFHPNAGPYWDERMKSVDMVKIINAVQDYIRSGKNG